MFEGSFVQWSTSRLELELEDMDIGGIVQNHVKMVVFIIFPQFF